jgi:exodeoxyribonuclease-3
VRIVSLNANGIRSAHRKGLAQWIARCGADIICLQEVRAPLDQLTDDAFWPAGYHCQYLEASKRGYSGVGIYSRWKPDAVVERIGLEGFDSEARYLEFRIGELSVASVYLPSGTSGDERQQFKYGCMDHLQPLMREMVASGRHYVLCGDWNIAHKEIDIRNWRGNKKNSGFLPQERAWLDEIYDDVGMVDAFRRVDSAPDRYTWWSNRGQAYAKNVGWRLDLQIVTPDLAELTREASIFTDERFSDHAPLVMDYDYKPAKRRLSMPKG